MTENGNGAAPPEPVPVLAGHLVIYPDMVAFRPDGGTDEQVIYRPINGKLGQEAIGIVCTLLSPGNGGQLGAVIASGADTLNPAEMLKSHMAASRKARKAVKAGD